MILLNSPKTKFDKDRPLKKALADALDARGYTTLTAVQQAVANPDTTGKDMLVSAQTGSGKTVGFGLAIAPALLGDAEQFEQAAAPLALIITPTRELALQVKRELAWLFDKAGSVLASTVGGMDMRDERRALARGAHMVVATPGRLRDHIMRGSIDLSALRAVVLDEADEMLDLGFREDLEFILDSAPADRQTLLFSATVPPAIAKLAKSYQNDALRIATVSATSQHADIDYRALQVSAHDGENAIINVLRYYEAPNAIVFCNTRAMVNRLTTRLSNRGFSVVALSGELTQTERTHALQAMRDGRARVCVATDVAARGIDLPNLELVIHAELPTNQDTLLHRSGRTGRAGRKGVSALIVPPAARKKAERLLGWAKLRAEWADAPSAEAVTARDEERMLANPDWLEPVSESDTETVSKLTAHFSAEQIAAAYLRLYRERHSAPEELSDAHQAPKPRPAFGPSVWFSLEGGRATGAEPRRVLPMLCKFGNLSREDIGAIRIQPDASLVEIRQDSVAGFLAAVGPGMVVEDGARLTQLDAAPNLDSGPRRSEDRPRPKPSESRDAKPRAPKRREPQSQPQKPEPKPRPQIQSQPPAPEPKQASAAPQDAPSDAPKPRKSPPREIPAPRAEPRTTLKAPDGKTPGSTMPVDWNDAPKPRIKKPKPGSKPPFKPKGDGAKPVDPSVSKPWKKRDFDGSKPKSAEDRPSRAGGPKPPAGKPSSKKNRARALAAGKPPAKGFAGRKPGKPGPKGKNS